MWALGLSFAAGALTVFSPCVLPVIPLVAGSASRQHRHGPLALAAGVSLSFAAAGTVISFALLSAGMDPAVTRRIAAWMLAVFGIVLASGALQGRLERIVGPLGARAAGVLQRGSFEGWKGQFLAGVLLGAVWSPCAGPTLGAAAGLASQSSTVAEAALRMLFFGAGAVTPLAAAGYGLQSILVRRRALLGRWSAAGRLLFGALLTGTALLILSGLDRKLEAALLTVFPPGWVSLITRF